MSERPAQPPLLRARPRLTRAQRLGLPLILLIPLLALAGFFGEGRSAADAIAGDMHVVANVPTRFRYRQRMTLDVAVTNVGRRALDSVRAYIDSAYLARFSDVLVEPTPSASGVVALGSIPPGQSVWLRATLDGDRSGSIHGQLLVWTARGDSARVPLTSVVFP